MLPKAFIIGVILSETKDLATRLRLCKMNINLAFARDSSFCCCSTQNDKQDDTPFFIIARSEFYHDVAISFEFSKWGSGLRSAWFTPVISVFV